MYKKLRFLTTMLLLAVCCGTWAEEVTYTISSKNTLTVTGTAPANSSATIAETYQTSCQMTKNNSQTLTLKGYNGCSISKITLSMKSNSKGGGGSFSYSTNGGSSFTYVIGNSSTSGSNFSSSSWHGSWSTSYVDVDIKDDQGNLLTFDCGSSDVIIKIEATANSLYCQSYTLTYTNTSSDLEDCDLALANSPVSLNFDLYNNASAQTISYTTSSTGAVTVSESEYVTTTVNNGIISVTPVKVTPSAQTITVNQAATDTYAAGAVTFTVSIADSTPFTGGDVTFVCGEDKTSGQSLTKNGVTMSFDSSNGGTWDRTDNYRLYSGHSMTISTATGKITSITFTISQNNFSGDGYNSETKTWTGNESSVTLAADGGQVRFTPVVVTVDTSGKQPAGLAYETTEYTVNLGETFSAPTLTNPNNLSVTYASSNESVATVNEETGAVTTLAAGTTTITASSEETEQYLAGSATYTLSVIDPNAPGTESNPYTIAQARAAIDANTGITGVYATGIVSEIVTAYDSRYGNISYNISTDGTTTADQLQAYRGKSYNGDNFTSADDIQVGDVVVVYGNLKKYTKDGVDTYEFDANNQLVSLQRPVITTPSISLSETTINATAEEAIGTINVTYNNITDVLADVKFYEADGETPATYDWLEAEINTDNNLDYVIDSNSGEARTAYMRVYSMDNENNLVYSEVITINQEAAPSLTINIASACTDGNNNYYGTFYSDKAYVMNDMLEGQVVSVDADGKLVVETAYNSGEVVPANTALLIYAVEPGSYNVYTTTAAGEDWSEYNMLKGTLTADEMTTGDNCLFYRLTMHNGTQIGFWWGAADGAAFKPGANKAYLAVPAEQAKAGFAFEGGDATSISTIDNGQLTMENAYNLQGQKVGSEYKGIVIVNGKARINK